MFQRYSVHYTGGRVARRAFLRDLLDAVLHYNDVALPSADSLARLARIGDRLLALRRLNLG